ncbi:MAG: type IV secretory system conjugative DNA transfer family protein, partial [Acidobacteria bacterium]|nr:type IV secretory system conjugative DNA transfer family protein [Acidobacteriota bacterium]
MILAVLLLGAVGLAWYVASEHLHLTHAQIAELSLYTLLLLTAATLAVLLPLTSRQRRERQWPHSPLVMAPDRIRGEMQSAWDQNAIVLGHDIHGKPWLWPDRIRVMQAILLGMTGSGKTTLLKNIVIQDLYRTVGQLEDPRRIPMIILDGKGDQEFFHDLL